MARPTIMKPDVIAKLEEAFAWGCSDVEACLWADIAPATLYKYQEKHPEFTERKAELKETPIMLARKTVIKGVKVNPDLALKFLERKKKDEFSTKTETDLSVKELPKPILGGQSIKKSNGVHRDNSTT